MHSRACGQREWAFGASFLLVVIWASGGVHAQSGSDAAPVQSLPAALEQLQQSARERVPPLLAALTSLRGPDPLEAYIDESMRPATSDLSSKVASKVASNSNSNSGGLSDSSSGSSSRIMVPGALDALRPAAAAALLAATHSDPVAPLTDEDISAINVLLGHEERLGSFVYDTGLPSLPNLVTFGKFAKQQHGSNFGIPTKNGSSLLSLERLGELAGAGGPMSWVVRSYSVAGDTLLKLRLTQALQLILRDAIADSAAQFANLPPSQVVSFAAANVSFCLVFQGVEFDSRQDSDEQNAVAGTKAAGASDGEPANVGLRAVKAALHHLAGDFDAGHISVSFQAFPAARRPPRSRAAATSVALLTGAPPAATDYVNSSGSSTVVQPASASGARKLLLPREHAFVAGGSSGSSSGQGRRLVAATGAPELTVVYVRLHSMDPTNVTTVTERLLGNCSNPTPAPAGASLAAAAFKPGQKMQPTCAAVFRQEFEEHRVPVAPGSAFSVAPFDKAQASITLSVAIGLTQEQQMMSDLDVKAAAWLNSTAVRDIFSTFNLTTETSEHDYMTYLRDRGSGRFPLLPGFNFSTIIPTIFEQVVAGTREQLQLQRQAQQAQQGQQVQQPGVMPSVAISKGIIAGIVIAVVASVLALVGVVVLLLRRRSDAGGQPQQAAAGAAAGEAGGRRRRRRPRVYNTKFLPTPPVLGHDPAEAGPSSRQAAATSNQPSPAAAAAAHAAGSAGGAGAAGLADAHLLARHLQRGDSVMSQVQIELDDAAQEASDVDDIDVDIEDQQSTSDTGGQGQEGQVQQQQQQWRLRTMPANADTQQPQHRQDGTTSSSNLAASSAAATSGVPPIIRATVSRALDGSGSVASTVSITLTSEQASDNCGQVSSSYCPDSHVMAGSAVARPAGGAARHRLAAAGAPSPTQQQLQPQGIPAGRDTTPRGPGTAMVDLPAAAGDGNASSGPVVTPASAFAAMDAQLVAQKAAARRSKGAACEGGITAVARSGGSGAADGGGGSSGGGSSGGGSSSSTASADKVCPLGQSCWHPGGYESGFLTPEAAATSAPSAASSGGGSQLPRQPWGAAGGQQRHQQQQQQRSGSLMSPFANAVQLAHSVASDEVCNMG